MTMVSSILDSQTLYGQELLEMTIRLGSTHQADVNIYGVQDTYTRTATYEYIITDQIMDEYRDQEFVESMYDLQRKEAETPA
jgi:hypothetical protein